jgi:histidinol phosphatase-like PHP family hydrolase
VSDDHLSIFDGISRAHVPRGDFHIHTTWTDGTRSVRDMYDAAVAAGLEMALFSEHARRSSGDWFPKFADEVRSLPQDGCKALVGVETKVDDLSGAIDCTDEILSHCDLVMASVHRFRGGR